MPEVIPIGEVVKLMDRGVITLPSKYRKALNIEEGELLNIFPWEGLLIVAPVSLKTKIKVKREIKDADWTTDRPLEYMKKVRYNPLEKLWAKRLREGW